MARKRIPFSGLHPYHINARCINKEWFSIPLEQVWEVMENYLFLTSHCFNLKIYSFVLMNNHFHALVRCPDNNLSATMNYFMRETSRQIGKLAGRINQVYGSRYHKTLISEDRYFNHAYKYIYQNPVRAGIVDKAENYKYSTLGCLLGLKTLLIPVVGDHLLFAEHGPERILNWINHNPQASENLEIRLALRRSEFLLTAPNSNKRSCLETVDFY